MGIDQVVAFTNEDTTQCGVIQVVNDMILEIDEQLSVTVISSDSSVQVPTTPASVVIQDDDSKWLTFSCSYQLLKPSSSLSRCNC